MDKQPVIHLGLSPRAAEFLKAACEDQIEAVGDEDDIYSDVIREITEQLPAKPKRKAKGATKN
jgi:hypothetical protein